MKRPLCTACVFFVCACILCLHFFSLPFPDFQDLEGSTVKLTGQVCEKEYKESINGTTLVITLRSVSLQDQKVPEGQVICYLKEKYPEPEMGSWVLVRGTLSNFERAGNPGQFDQAEYYRILKKDFRLYNGEIQAKSQTYHQYQEGLYRLKEKCFTVLEQCLEPRDASVLKTMLLGGSQIDKEIMDLYKRNGIVHILSISGLHISIIGMGFYGLLRKAGLPLGLATAMAIAVICSYGVMTGMGTSAARAIIMFGLRMLAHILGRTYDMLTALAVAAVLILCEQPLYLYHSGFLFSFLAVMAIGIFVPAMTVEIKGRKPLAGGKPAYMLKFANAFLGGASISAFTLPVYLWFYYQFPLYSILLNLIVIPLTSIIMPAGLLVIAAGSLYLPLGKLAAMVVKGILWVYEQSCLICDKLPFGNLVLGKPEVWQIWVYSALLLILVLFHKKLKMAVKWVMLVVGMVILVLRIPSGMQLTFLDVGQGDGIYIQSAAGKHYLIDGGSSSVQKVGEYRLIPFLKASGAGRLEAVFITHPDLDHYSGILELIEQAEYSGIVIGNLILPDIGGESMGEEYQKVEAAAKAAGIPVSRISRGQVIRDGDLTIECLHPEAGSLWGMGDQVVTNEYSQVLLIRYKRFSALLTGDVEGQGERIMTEYWKSSDRKPITLLKVAHHGSKNSTPEELLGALRPEIAVISAGKGNSYGHPHGELLERLEAEEPEIYITFETGAVTVRTDGERMEIKKFLSTD